MHPVPGTTRDLLTETITLGGLRVTLADTAGVRASDDLVEREGVARAERARAAADLVLVVLDGSEALTLEDGPLLGPCLGDNAPPCLVVKNKADLRAAWDPDRIPGAISVSCEDGRGVDDLIRSIARILLGEEGVRAGDEGVRGETSTSSASMGGAGVPGLREGAMVTNARHVALLEEAASALADGLALFDSDPGTPEEIVLSDVQRAREALEQVTGKRTTDDLLQEIFSSFCIGK